MSTKVCVRAFCTAEADGVTSVWIARCGMGSGSPRAYERHVAYWLIPPAEKMAGTGPAIFRCSNTDRAPDDLVTVGADRGA